MTQEIFLIYARAANGTIGKDGSLPWHIPADLKHFKALTLGESGTGRPMIMGRKTFDSFPAPLPGRRHIVLTRDRDWHGDGAEPAHSVQSALSLAGDGPVAVIGGAEIYPLFLPLADRIELTEVHADFAGDTSMPAVGCDWAETARTDHPAQDGRPAFSFVTLKRTV